MLKSNTWNPLIVHKQIIDINLNHLGLIAIHETI